MHGPCVIVPAFEAAATVGQVVDDLLASLRLPVIVVDDGSADATGELARAHGARVVRHLKNRGKGAAITSGLREAQNLCFNVALTVDADGQHPAGSARLLLENASHSGAIVLGVRDLAMDRAPLANRFGNGVSNFFVSFFAGKRLRDTQCGLRRYPVAETLALGARAQGYAFEAEVLLRAVAAGVPIVEVPVSVRYPPPEEALRTHFRVPGDPARIVATVVRTVLELRLGLGK
jgi:glycosyltransferase involved in cell wall biosynthesis